MPRDTSSEWVVNRPSRRLSLDWRELWAYRELVYFLGSRDLKARYKQAAFGIGWAILQPLAGVAVFTLVFRGLAGVPSDGLPYALFALSGFVAWTYFSSTLTAATASLVSNASLVTKVYFPRVIAPMSALLPGLVALGLGVVLTGIVMVITAEAPTWALLALPLCVLGLMVVSFAVSLLFAALNVRYRDVGALLGTLIQLWLFASPVAYPSSLVSEDWRWAYDLNPMVGVIDAFRWSLVGGSWPGTAIAEGAAVTAVLLMLGLTYFARAERRFADVI